MNCFEAEVWSDRGYQGRVRYYATSRSEVRLDMALRGETPGEIHLDPTRAGEANGFDPPASTARIIDHRARLGGDPPSNQEQRPEAETS